MPRDNEDNIILESDIQVDSRQEVDEPKLYKVIMHNDHYTTMDFVVEALVTVFHKSAAEATKLMLEIHNRGLSICGTYTYDIAVTKISQVHQMAKNGGFPLKCSYEEA